MGAITYLAIFCTGASVFASLLAFSACILSARISQAENTTAVPPGHNSGHQPARLEPISSGD